MMHKRKAVILINVGTPDHADRKSVLKYLTAFLNDKRVIDVPAILRFFLVNFIIIPFRLNKSTARYKKVWTENGSPLLFNTLNLKNKLRAILPEDFDVFVGMRYGNPSLKRLLKEIEPKRYSKIIIFPLFPQYASATTGTVIEKVLKEINHWNCFPNVKIVSQFHDHPGFYRAFADRVMACHPEKYEHILFSFHSLPLKQIQKMHPDQNPETCSCNQEMPSQSSHCYMAACYETARLIAASANIERNNYTVCFQSRFKGKWLGPFTEDIISRKAKEGCKHLLVVSPSFVGDCLETIYDIEWEGKDLFRINGGIELQLVESLNDHKDWVHAIKQMVMEE